MIAALMIISAQTILDCYYFRIRAIENRLLLYLLLYNKLESRMIRNKRYREAKAFSNLFFHRENN